MILLGIETSCDETSIAILIDNNVIINLVSSQLIHQEFGGVVPEYASREHMRLIQNLVKSALKQTGIVLSEIDGVAVTRGPGLMGALLVGLNFAKGLCYSLNKPLLAVNHVEGHIMANFLDHTDLEFPFLCLLVSGGHTQIIEVKDFGDYTILGRSLDDAAGEAFDKAARILGLGYPGGVYIDELSKDGNPKFYDFPRAKIKSNLRDFSFSGLKTSILYLVKQQGVEWANENIKDLCASYQQAIVDVLKTNTFLTAEEYGFRKIVLAGGVAANSKLREEFTCIAQKIGVKIYFPSLEYCTDNAAMITRAGIEMMKRNIISPLSVSAVPNLSLIS